jgi:peroxiredoxin
MKNLFTLLLLVCSITVFAQLPEKAEDISPLLIGEKIPDVTIKNAESTAIKTTELFNKKTVLIFYRGGWCPYCNAHLSELQGVEEKIVTLGYQIVAISPDAPSFLKETINKEKINYQLFSDADGTFTKACGLAFATPEKYGKMLDKYSDGKNDGFLPVPTVYVLNNKGIIEFMHINPDYSKRLSADLLLAVLQNSK